MLKDRSLKILIISSADPCIGPGTVGMDYYHALQQGGYDVDLMTKYPVDGYPEILNVCDRNAHKERSYVARAASYLRYRMNQLLHRQRPGYHFFYRREICPPVPVKDVLNKIIKPYDVVIVVFWQELLSFATIDAIYDKLKCQIQFHCVDYSAMSGGCHFTGSCQNYMTGCGCCPGIYSKRGNDFTRWNTQYRERVYSKVKPIVFGNSYMVDFYRKSYLLKDYDRVETGFPLVDNRKFYPHDAEKYRSQYQIPLEKRFLIFFGSQDLGDERKGFIYLLEALHLLYDSLTASERDEILLVIAGRNIDRIKDRLCFDYKYLGFVDSEELSAIYSMSNVYLSPSVNDAGPSMVNQSMSCGTPVVAFEMGTALDVIKDRETGYCAKLCDSEDFAKGIASILHLSNIEYLSLRKNCREVAEQLTSDEAFVRNFLRVYNKYK